MDTHSGSTSSWDYLDFELEIRGGGPREYPVAVRSPAGEAQAEMRLPFDEWELKDRLQSLEIALLRSGGTRRRIPSPEEHTVQDFGRGLFESLLVGDVRTRFEMSLSEARRQGKGLRLKLRIQPSELAVLPWEFLYDAERDRYPSLSSNTPLVRYLDLPQPVEPLRVSPPLRVLGMVTSPLGLNPLDVEHEKRLVEEAIRGLREGGLLELTWLEGQTWRHLQRAMRRGPWHIFHFVGHGGFDPATEEGALALSDDAGRMHLLRAYSLAELLDDHYPLRLVFLNSCEGARGSENDAFSSTAATLVRRGVPAVVAMQYEITDRAAIEFSRDFYEALADSLPVDAAVTEARAAVSMDSMLEWGTPVLYMHSPDGRVFDISTPAARTHPTRESEDRHEEDSLDWHREGAESAGEQTQRVTALYDRGQRHMKAQEWQQALECFEEIQLLEPNYRDTKALLAQARQRDSADNAEKSEASEGLRTQVAGQSTDQPERVHPDYSAATQPQPLSPMFGRNWWALALAGAIMVILGLIVIWAFSSSVGQYFIFFRLLASSSLIAIGVFTIIASRTAHPKLLLRTQGVIGVLAGLLALLTGAIPPSNDPADFSNFTAALQNIPLLVVHYSTFDTWALTLGIIQITAAIRVGREFKVMGLMIVSGASLLVYGMFGFYLLVRWAPFTPWLVIWLLASGISLVVFAFMVRQWEEAEAEG